MSHRELPSLRPYLPAAAFFFCMAALAVGLGWRCLRRQWSRRSGWTLLITAALMLLISARALYILKTNPPYSDPGLAMGMFEMQWFGMMTLLLVVQVSCFVSLQLRVSHNR